MFSLPRPRILSYGFAWVAATTLLAPVLPPGMIRTPESNADGSPPPVPYDSNTPRVVAREVASWPHDSLAFTQGLVMWRGHLFEGTGLEGQSDVREVELTSGRVLRRAPLESQYFGEGVVVHDSVLYQLTWKHGRGFTRDVSTFAVTNMFTYSGEGWGLTSDGQRLYMSDGKSRVFIIDPNGFRFVDTLAITEAGKPVWWLNELEWVDGELWANIYMTDLIARINPATGNVVGWIDVGRLLTTAEGASVRRRGGTANGIAYDASAKRVFVTGKLWPRMFEIHFRE